MDLPSSPIGFIKVDVPKCTTTTRQGKPCNAPRKKGTLFCVNHQAMAEHFPAPPEVANEVIPPPELSTADRRALQAKRGEHRRNGMDSLRELAEVDFKRIVRPFFDALEATKTVYLPGQGEFATDLPDHKLRMEAASHLLDRAWGKPTTRQEVTGEGGGPVTIAAMVVDLANRAAKHEQLEAAGKMDDYYTSLPGEDVEDAEVVEPPDDRPVV